MRIRFFLKNNIHGINSFLFHLSVEWDKHPVYDLGILGSQNSAHTPESTKQRMYVTLGIIPQQCQCDSLTYKHLDCRTLQWKPLDFVSHYSNSLDQPWISANLLHLLRYIKNIKSGQTLEICMSTVLHMC